MPTQQTWEVLIAAAPAATAPVTAQTFLKKWESYSKPVAFGCDDGHTYVVKGRAGIERSMIAERVVAQLAALLNAPVPPVALVDIPAALVTAEPQLDGLFPPARPAHGSRMDGKLW